MKSPRFRIYAFYIVFVCIIACAPKIQLGKFDKLPQPSTPDQELLIEEGIIAHDQGNYDAAILKYEEVLARNPDNILALYELSLTYFFKQDWQQSLNTSIRGTEYDSPYLPFFYSAIGSSLSNMQRSKEAITLFKDALKRFPNDYMLHYNLGTAYYKKRQITHSKESFKKALTINPEHASSHLGLANSLHDENNEIPALMGYCRFLILEPNSQRTMIAQERVLSIIGAGVQEDSLFSSQININIFSNPPVSEGDFGAVRLALSMLTAMAISDTSEQDDSAHAIIDLFDSLFQIMSEMVQSEEKTGFGWEFYVPYFTELQRNGFVDAFVQHIFQLEDIDEAQIAKFLEWSKGY